jgi:hypothetical protein
MSFWFVLLIGILGWFWYLSATKTKRHAQSAVRNQEQKDIYYVAAGIEADTEFDKELSLINPNDSTGYLVNVAKAHYVAVRKSLSVSSKSTFRLGETDSPDHDWLRQRVQNHAKRINCTEMDLGRNATNASLAILISVHDQSIEISNYLMQRFPNSGNALHRSNNFHYFSEGMSSSGIYAKHREAVRIAAAYIAVYGHPDQKVLFARASRL